MIVRSARRVLSNLLRFHSSSKETSATEEDTSTRRNPVRLERHKERQRDDEGRTSMMGHAIRIVSPRRDDSLEWEMDLHNSSSLIKDLSDWLIIDEARPFEVVNSVQNGDSVQQNSERMAERARAMGKLILKKWSLLTNGCTLLPFQVARSPPTGR